MRRRGCDHTSAWYTCQGDSSFHIFPSFGSKRPCENDTFSLHVVLNNTSAPHYPAHFFQPFVLTIASIRQIPAFIGQHNQKSELNVLKSSTVAISNRVSQRNRLSNGNGEPGTRAYTSICVVAPSPSWLMVHIHTPATYMDDGVPGKPSVGLHHHHIEHEY